MRYFLLAAIAHLCSASLFAAEPDVVSPGMDFAAVKSTLKKHQCEISKCEMAIVLKSKDYRLECGDLDDEMLLLVMYSNSTQRVLSLEVQFIPNGRSPKFYRVYRTVSKVVFENDDTVELSLERNIRPKVSDPVEKVNSRD